MSWKSHQLGGTRTVALNMALTLTSTPDSGAAGAPTGTALGNIYTNKLSEWISTGEVWRPLGVNVCATTTITVTAPVMTLQKAPAHATANVFVSAATGGVATLGLLVAKSAAYYPFSHGSATAGYTFAAADAAGDVWRVTVGTSPSAGAANLQLHYALIAVANISEAVTTL